MVSPSKNQDLYVSNFLRTNVRLFNLIRDNRLEDFKSLIENEEINPDDTSYNGSPLIVFLANDKAKVPFLEYILSIGANVNITDLRERSALFQACSSGNKEAVKLLLQHKELEIDKENKAFAFVMNAVTVAILQDHYIIAKMLMDARANPTKAEEILLNEDQLYKNAYNEKYKRLVNFYKRWHNGKKQILLALYFSKKSKSNSMIQPYNVSLIPYSLVIKIADEFL